jgi:hypothetical protein
MAGQPGGKPDARAENPEDEGIATLHNLHRAPGANAHGHEALQVIGIVDALNAAAFLQLELVQTLKKGFAHGCGWDVAVAPVFNAVIDMPIIVKANRTGASRKAQGPSMERRGHV